ncbi:STAS domain-containing protein, partial [Magnetococcales bacterium HHB-1]
DAWIHNTLSSHITETSSLLSEEDVRRQSARFFQVFKNSLPTDQEKENQAKILDDHTTQHLTEISRDWAQSGFKPSQTALFIFSLRETLLEFLHTEIIDDISHLNHEVVRVSQHIDRLGLVTFEAYVATREQVIHDQSISILELSTPVIKLWHEIVLLPLVGVVDTKRAQHIIENLLEEIVKQEARIAIIDLTGVPVIDTQVASHLVRTVSAANMLGAHVIICGISPVNAQTMTKLGVNTHPLHTTSTLRSAMKAALKTLGLRISALDQPSHSGAL